MARKTCAVVIATHNRRDELSHTLTELRRLSPQPEEIIVFLDGCTDGSRQMLDRDFPECRVMESSVKRGSIPSRDEAFRSVRSELILSLDDDSYPIQSDFIARLSELVDCHPEAGAMTFPEIRNDGRSPDTAMGVGSPGHYVSSFPNCAGVAVRSLYGEAAEYPTFFSHMYEEPDYSVQLYAAGYAVWFEPSLAIRHHFTPNERNMLARHHLNARNEVWSVLLRCPFPYAAAVVAFRLARQFQFAARMGWRWWSREPLWWWEALKGVPRCFRHRKPAPWHIYVAWMRLARAPVHVAG